MRILNLFAGIGGNRTLWGNKHEITAIEFDPNIATVYKQRFPNDKVIVEDAYKFLELNYEEFDFIWASPPCPSHSRLRTMPNMRNILPDFHLYAIITFLDYWFKGKYCIENVIPYYPYVVKPTVLLGRHPFWANFNIPIKGFIRENKHLNHNYELLLKEHNINEELFQNKTKTFSMKILDNCVDYRIGKYILDCVKITKQYTLKDCGHELGTKRET